MVPARGGGLQFAVNLVWSVSVFLGVCLLIGVFWKERMANYVFGSLVIMNMDVIPDFFSTPAGS